MKARRDSPGAAPSYETFDKALTRALEAGHGAEFADLLRTLSSDSILQFLERYNRSFAILARQADLLERKIDLFRRTLEENKRPTRSRLANG